MKKSILTIAALCLALCGFAQEKKITFKPYGFVRNYACFDSRDNLSSNSDQFNMIPKDEALNGYGDDLNAKADILLLSITTRLGLNITGPDFLGAKTSAKIESDFAGFGTSNTVLRIRQAYAKMEWEKNSILAGQAWHPMMGDMMPDVFSLETGAPFTPFSRTPQVRYDYKNKGFTLTATALYQYQYTSYGPDGASFNYARNAIVPELYFQAMYKNGGFMIGAGVDLLTLKPRQSYTMSSVNENGGTVTDTYKCKEDPVVSISPTIFASYKKGNWGVKGRFTYAQNAAHLSMISGYGVTAVNENGEQEYGSINSAGGWVDVTYKKTLKKGFLTFCCFAGYTKNLGCKDEFTGPIYMRGEKNMDNMWRVSPSVLYTHNAMQIGIEYNPTTVAYGTPDSQYKMSDTHNVTNHRICAMLKYNF